VNPGPETAVSAARLDAARFARQALFLSFAIACVLIRPSSRPPFLVATGFVPARGAMRSYAAGFLAGAVPIIALIVVLVLLGARRVELRASVGMLAWYTLKFVLLGIVLVVLEEGVFRGLVLGDLARSFGVRIGVVVASAFFAATHFLGVSDAWRAVPDPNPGAFEVVTAVLTGLERMVREWPELVGLFLVGLILSILRVRSGALYLGMGVHAGWFWVRSIDRYFVREVESVVEAHRTWLGTSQYLDGIVGWLALLATLGLAATLRLTEPPPESRDQLRSSP